MYNTPHNAVFSPGNEHDEFIAPGSKVRLWLLGSVFSLAAMIVIGRVAWVQTQLPDDYLDSLGVTTIEEEAIPARDGRILADALVLAADVEQSSLQMHYRWLQSEADQNWMKQQIRQVLSRDERKNADLVAKAERNIQESREAMFMAVSEVTGMSREDLRQRCKKIELRVRKISDTVNQKISGVDIDAEADEELDEDDSPGPLMRWASSIRDALTTPPQREEADRIVVREEETWHGVLENVSAEVAARINEYPEQFPGVRVVAVTQRTYPQNQLAAHVVGARTKVTEKDRDAEQSSDDSLSDQGRSDQMRSGRFGVEKSYDHRIAGMSGLRRIVRDRRQRVVSSEIVRRPVSGRDVVLTLDTEVQKVAEQLLAESLGDAEKELLLPPPEVTNESEEPSEDQLAPPEPEHIPTGGCVVVMEVDSGRIVAAASAPTFDLSMFTEGTAAQWEMVNSDARRPFVSRFTGMALPPGSTFKIVTAIAGLQTDVLSPDMLFDCQGYLENPDEHRCLIYRLHGRGHGDVNLRTAMAQSCNVYFFDAACRMGIQPLEEWTRRLQFGKASGIDLPFEKAGTVPAVRRHPNESEMPGAAQAAAQRRFEREALGLSIGQSRLTVTPLQMVRLLAAVANGGWLVTPHVASDEGVARQASELDDSPFRVSRQRISVLTDQILNSVREGLEAVVEEPIGTGFKTVRLPGIRIAGKTGTAEASPGKPDHAWFAGYAPADKPRYAFVVVLEHGGSGGKAAGPVAREMVRCLSQQGLLRSAELTRVEPR